MEVVKDKSSASSFAAKGNDVETANGARDGAGETLPGSSSSALSNSLSRTVGGHRFHCFPCFEGRWSGGARRAAVTPMKKSLHQMQQGEGDAAAAASSSEGSSSSSSSSSSSPSSSLPPWTCFPPLAASTKISFVEEEEGKVKGGGGGGEKEEEGKGNNGTEGRDAKGGYWTLRETKAAHDGVSSVLYLKLFPVADGQLRVEPSHHEGGGASDAEGLLSQAMELRLVEKPYGAELIGTSRATGEMELCWIVKLTHQGEMERTILSYHDGLLSSICHVVERRVEK